MMLTAGYTPAPATAPTSPATRKLVKTKHPGIYKRGNRYVVRYRDPAGKARKKAARTISEAIKLKAELTADIARGEYRATSTITLPAYVEEWLVTYTGRTSRGIRPETLAEYEYRLRRFAIPYFGRSKLAAIEPRHIKAFIAHLSGKGLSRNTVRLAVAPLKAMLATAYEDGLIRTNPAAGVRILTIDPAAVEAESAKVKAMTDQELARVLAAIQPDWLPFFLLLAQTGLRFSEAVALRWQDIDLTGRRLYVRRRYRCGRFAAPKSKHAVRDFPITATLTQTLGDLRGRGELTGDHDLIFPTSAGTVIDESNLRRRVLKPAARQAGVDWIGFHTFRHTVGSSLFRHGWNAKQVQKVLGHHSAAFTLATYIHLVDDDLPAPDVLDLAITRHPRGADLPSRGSA